MSAVNFVYGNRGTRTDLSASYTPAALAPPARAAHGGAAVEGDGAEVEAVGAAPTKCDLT